jgi:hypothetical protein
MIALKPQAYFHQSACSFVNFPSIFQSFHFYILDYILPHSPPTNAVLIDVSKHVLLPSGILQFSSSKKL